MPSSRAIPEDHRAAVRERAASSAGAQQVEKRAAGQAMEFCAVFLLAMALTAWMTWPLAAQMRDHARDGVDSLLNAYIHAWGAHALLSHPSKLFDANLFYPATDTFALSENLLGNQIFFAPVYLATGNANLANNFVILLSFVLCVCSMYLLVRWATGSAAGGLIAGVIFAFAPARTSQIVHNQLLSTEWLPLIVLFLYRFLLRRRIASLAAFAAFVLLQVLCSLYLGYLALLVAVAYVAAVALIQPRLLSARAVWQLAVAGLLVAALLYPIVRPYRALQGTALHDEYSSQVAMSASPIGSYLDSWSRQYHDLLMPFHSREWDGEKQLFVGFIPLGMALLGIGAAWRAAQSEDDGPSRPARPGATPPGFLLGSIFVLISAYVLSLGPVLRIRETPTGLRLPFYYLDKVIPGLTTFRVPARFGALVPFALGILAAAGFAHLTKWMNREPARRREYAAYASAALAVMVSLAICKEYRSAPLDLVAVSVSPGAEYRWLARQPMNAAVLELPITVQDGVRDPSQEARRVYASTFHWHPMVNGYSGHDAPSVYQMNQLIAKLPSAAAAGLLAGLGVRYVFLHTDEMSAGDLAPWDSDRPAQDFTQDITKIAQFGPTKIYELSSDCGAAPGAGASFDVQVPQLWTAGEPLPYEVAFPAAQRCWAPPGNGGVDSVTAEWRNAASGRTLRAPSVTIPPLVARAHENATMQGLLSAPEEPGAYSVTLAIPRRGVRLAPREVRLISRAERDSAFTSSLADLSARYELDPEQPRKLPGGQIAFRFKATNTGKAVWLPSGPGSPLATGPRPAGAVRLGFAWYDSAGRQLSEGGSDMPFAVYPGTSYSFWELLDLPSQAGQYVLKLELMAEPDTWFHENGSKPMELRVAIP